MILFFGTRPGKTQFHSLPEVACPYCEQRATMTLYKTSNWFHLFWIKLFKISSSRMAECSHCKKVFYEEEFSDAMQAAISN
ncbi:zinc-ribbon domain-containing protein [Maribacter algicola]|uniref:Zinc-ribbon domain-containing protein n=1 Tax=Meishania litoralis TaxID=3434685 RepID=A0ACC7LM59_9FLAO